MALFALITIQGLNPAWEYHEAGGKWWLQGLPYRPWLPHGISIPFTWHWDLVYAGAWRTLLVYVPIWMAVCAVWIGVTRRRTLQILFTALPLSALGFSVLGVFQRATEPATIYGWYKPSLHWFFGPFVYKNHAGAYLLLMIGITCGLGLWYHVRGLRRLEKSSPAPVFAFVTLCLAIATVMSSARGATLAMIGYLVTVAIALVWYRSRVGHRGVSAAVAILLLVAAAGIVVVAVKTLHSDTIWPRLQQALVGRDDSVEQRMTANYHSSEMLADHWGLGIGAGSFAFLFPPYQQRYPAVVTGEFWPHAHNDLIEFPLELGLPGVLIIAAGFTFWIRQIVRTRAWENPLSGCVLLVAATLLVMSVGDYIFFSPAILLTWCCLWPAALRWAQLDEMPKSRKTDMPKLAS